MLSAFCSADWFLGSELTVSYKMCYSLFFIRRTNSNFMVLTSVKTCFLPPGGGGQGVALKFGPKTIEKLA